MIPGVVIIPTPIIDTFDTLLSQFNFLKEIFLFNFINFLVFFISSDLIDFSIRNHSGYQQEYRFQFSDLMDGGTGMFSYSEGNFILGPNEIYELSFPVINSSFESTVINLSVWPKYNDKKIGIDYKKTTLNNIELNLILTPDNIIEKPIQCGNLKMLCLPEERLVCISEIKVKNGYYFISNTNNECLIQFQQNYWQH